MLSFCRRFLRNPLPRPPGPISCPDHPVHPYHSCGMHSPCPRAPCLHPGRFPACRCGFVWSRLHGNLRFHGYLWFHGLLPQCYLPLLGFPPRGCLPLLGFLTHDHLLFHGFRSHGHPQVHGLPAQNRQWMHVHRLLRNPRPHGGLEQDYPPSGLLYGFRLCGLPPLYGFPPPGFPPLYGFLPSGFPLLYGFLPSGHPPLYGFLPSGSQLLHGFLPPGFLLLHGFPPSGFPPLHGFLPPGFLLLYGFLPSGCPPLHGFLPSGLPLLYGFLTPGSQLLHGFPPSGCPPLYGFPPSGFLPLHGLPFPDPYTLPVHPCPGQLAPAVLRLRPDGLYCCLLPRFWNVWETLYLNQPQRQRCPGAACCGFSIFHLPVQIHFLNHDSFVHPHSLMEHRGVFHTTPCFIGVF